MSCPCRHSRRRTPLPFACGTRAAMRPSGAATGAMPIWRRSARDSAFRRCMRCARSMGTRFGSCRVPAMRPPTVRCSGRRARRWRCNRRTAFPSFFTLRRPGWWPRPTPDGAARWPASASGFPPRSPGSPASLPHRFWRSSVPRSAPVASRWAPRSRRVPRERAENSGGGAEPGEWPTPPRSDPRQPRPACSVGNPRAEHPRRGALHPLRTRIPFVPPRRPRRRPELVGHRASGVGPGRMTPGRRRVKPCSAR